MALDSSIILGVKPYQQDDPLERYSKLAGLEANQLTIDKAREERADEQAVRQAYQQSGGDSTVLRKLLTEGGRYKQIQALDKADLERREKEATIGGKTSETKKREFDMALEKTSRLSSMIASATDQAGWDGVRRNVELTFGPEAVANMPQQFDPQWQRTKIAEGQTITQYLQDQRRREELQGQRETREQTRATAPFTAGPGGVPVPNQPVQAYEQSKLPGNQPHYDPERGIVVTPSSGVGAPVTVGGQPLGTKPGAPHYDAERGIYVDPQTAVGTPVTVGGQPIGAKSTDKPLTDSQAKALLYSNRMAEAERIITDLSARGTNAGIPGIGGSATVNALAPEAQQSLIQAKRNFINAVLRRESGAVISPSEMAEADKQYFPQIGEGPAIIAQKAANRRTAMEGIQAEVPTQHRPTGQTTGTGTSLRMGKPIEEMAQIRAREQKSESIERDIASIEKELSRKDLKSTQIGILKEQLEISRRARDIQKRGGQQIGVNPAGVSGVSPPAGATGSATGGWKIERVN